MNPFLHIESAPSDPILGLAAAYQLDERPDKISLIAGVYKSEDLDTPVLSCVKEAEALLLREESSKNYLPIEGDPVYLKAASELILGKELHDRIASRLSVIQSIGGCGGLRIGGDLIQREIGSTIHIPDPSWPNHRGIFTQCGLTVDTYPYYDFLKKEVSFEDLFKRLTSLPPFSVIVLHVSCHNPSGADLSREQWTVLADLCVAKQLIPFFDAAYLGFNDSFEEDAFPIRLFAEKNAPFFLSVSFSKNLALYAERIGLLMIFSDKAPEVLSQLKILVRRNYSNPPIHGARIVTKILKNPDLKKSWESELDRMKARVREMRSLLVEHLPEEYFYIARQKGLFSFSGLSKNQVARLIQSRGIYMPSDGRINIAGITQRNVEAVAEAILSERDFPS